MSVIDSDAHVIEYDHTWAYMSKAEIKHRPISRKPPQLLMRALMRAVAIIKRRPISPNRPQSGHQDHGDKVVLPNECRNPREVQARLRHMDELGTDVQVLYPTLFISPYTDDPNKELAMSRSYNRWLADIWRQGNGRLRWAMVLPLRTLDKAIEEMRWAKQHGACAVFMRGVEIENKLLSDPYFYPVYEEASSLDIPVCIHTGNASEDISRIYANDSGFNRFKLVGVGACHNLLYTQTPDKFPKLRWGFIELSSQWIPYILNDLLRRFNRAGKTAKSNVLRDNRIFVACQTTDDLPIILDTVGEDCLVIGTDYGHADSSTEIYALQRFAKIESISLSARRKILDDNARALYGL